MDPTEIVAGRLHLRPWTLYDESAVLAACSDPLVARWTPLASPYMQEDAHLFVTQTAPQGWRDGTAATFAVLEATTGEVLASVGLYRIGGGTAEVGYLTAPHARGQGVVSEAVSALCRWGFAELGLQRIACVIGVGNVASRSVAEKCGFQFEGVARQEMLQRGTRLDGWVGALLPTDEVIDRRALPAPPVLSDGVVTLRGWRAEDAPDVARACDDPLTARWLPVPQPYTLHDGTWYVTDHIPGAWAEGTAAELAVVDDQTGELLGAMGLKLPNRHLGFGEVGYWTAPWARGRGVAGRGAALMARWGLDVLGLHRVELLADVDNVASQRAAEKGGFQREGVARRSRLDRDRIARDMVLFSLVAEDLLTP